MAEMIKSKRVFFPTGKQKKFIANAKSRLKLSWKELAEILSISVRNLIDWKNEKISMPFNAVKIICKKTKTNIPDNIEIKEKFWYAKKGAKLGGLNVYKKYGKVGGDPNYRKKKWQEWWEKSGRFNPLLLPNTTLPFKTPKKSQKLAEFTGIMIGDGGISRYQITITLHDKDDIEYSEFVLKLMKKLFGVNPSVYHDKKDSVNTLVISRSNLVKFLTDKIRLKIGNKIKQQVDIPNWIKKNKRFKVACLRGLMDTDGCLVLHRYKIKNKEYCYKKLEFCSASRPLIKSVMEILKEFDFRPRLSHNGRNVWIDNKNEVKRYFKIINSNNPKHKNRFLR